MLTYGVMVAGWAILCAMLANRYRIVTPYVASCALLVAGVWFGLCLAVLG
jgi:hypothetical protein